MIKNTIINRVGHPKKYNFHIWRGILEFLYFNPKTKRGKKNREQTKHTLGSIGTWVSGKYDSNPESVNYRYSIVSEFSDLWVLDDTVYIYTRRPDILIGKGGKTVDGLLDFLKTGASGVKHISIIECPTEETVNEIRMGYMVTEKYC